MEDEIDIQRVLLLALETLGGFEATMYGSGLAALDGIAAQPPDLVLLDAMLPGIDGTQVLAELKRNQTTAEIPVVFLTARVYPPEIHEYLEAGAADVIAKPFDPLTLGQRIQRVLDTLGRA